MKRKISLFKKDDIVYAAGFTEEGTHGPNQDRLYVHPPDQKLSGGVDEVMAMVADGVTASGISFDTGTGLFMADTFCRRFPDQFKAFSSYNFSPEISKTVQATAKTILASSFNPFLEHIRKKHQGKLPPQVIYGGTTLTTAIRRKDGGLTVYSKGNSPAWVVNAKGRLIASTPKITVTTIGEKEVGTGYFLEKSSGCQVTYELYDGTQEFAFDVSPQDVPGSLLCLVTDGFLDSSVRKKGESYISRNAEEVSFSTYDPRDDKRILDILKNGPFEGIEQTIQEFQSYSDSMAGHSSSDDRTAVLFRF